MNDYGPRVESIRKEDNARVRAIVNGDQRATQEEQTQARIEKFRATEREEAARRQAVQEELLAASERQRKRDERKALSMSKARSTNRDRGAPVASRARMLEMSQPKQHHEAMHGAGTYGKCMHQRTNRVEFPQGRNGAAYAPGIDRDRYVPTSSSSKATQSRGAQAKTAERDATVRGIRAAHESADGHHRHQDVEDAARRAAMEQGDVAVDDDDNGSEGGSANGSRAPSVFSHASSNGPILATGVPHMGMHSEKPTTQQHLEAYGGSVAAPRVAGTDEHNLADLTLPEVTTRLVQMQQSRKPKK